MTHHLHTLSQILKSDRVKLLFLFLFVFLAAVFSGHLYKKAQYGNEYLTILNKSSHLQKNIVADKDIYLIYVMDMNCSFSNNQEILSHMNQLVKKSKILSFTEDFNIKFELTTVNDPYKCFSLLSEIENVDEINFGNGWHNSTLSNFIINQGHSKSTPQLLIIKRDNRINQHGNDRYYSGFTNEEILFHFNSMPQIMAFDFMDLSNKVSAGFYQN